MNPLLYDVVAEAVRRQPWYAKNANTIVAVLTLVTSALSVVAALQLDLPPAVAVALPIAIQTIGTFITKLMPNGVQMGMTRKLADAAGVVVPMPAFPVDPQVLTAEIDRARATVHDGLAEFNPVLTAEIERIAGGFQDTAKHRLIE